MIYAGILAAGIGARMHRQDLPKQFLQLGDKPILINTLEQFFINPNIDRIIVVIPDDWKLFTDDMISQYDTMGTEVFIITGGKNKAMSVRRVVEYIKSTWGIEKDDILVAHDAVRPFVTQRIIDENIRVAQKYDIAGTVVATNDTIVVSDSGDKINEIPIKKKMLAQQTPLTFRLEILDNIFERASGQNIPLELETELARMCIKLGYSIHIVQGESSNMKIITPYDLEVANILLTERKS